MQEITVHVVEYSKRKNLVMRYVDPFTGKQKTKSASTNKRREAEKLAAKWEAELREGRYNEPSKATWDDFRERYEDEVLSGHAEGTGQRPKLRRIHRPKRPRSFTPKHFSDRLFVHEVGAA